MGRKNKFGEISKFLNEQVLEIEKKERAFAVAKEYKGADCYNEFSKILLKALDIINCKQETEKLNPSGSILPYA